MTTITTTKSPFYYGNPELPRFNAWVENNPDTDWSFYARALEVSNKGKGFQMMRPSVKFQGYAYNDKVVWIEREPQTRGDPNLQLLSQVIYGEEFKIDPRAPRKAEKKFKALLNRINRDVSDCYSLFRNESAFYRGCEADQGELEGFGELVPDEADIGDLLPGIISDFCDHLPMWCYAYDRPLFGEGSPGFVDGN